MKTVVLLLGLMMGSLGAAPRLFVSTPELQPESEVEIIFDEAMVEVASVGMEMAAGLVGVKPELEGVLRWKAQNVVGFELKGLPVMGREYSFTLRRKMVDATGKVVDAGLIGKVQAEPFKLEAASLLARWKDQYSPRTGRHYLRFNDDVQASAIAEYLYYENEAKQKIAAATRQATVGDLDHAGQINKPWRERAVAAPVGDPARPAREPALEPETTLANAVVVTPLAPLAPARGWRLVVASGLPNSSGAAKLAEAGRDFIGNIEPFAVEEARADTTVNEPRHIEVRFNNKLPEAMASEEIAKFVTLTPEPDKLSFVAEGNSLRIEGDFSAEPNWTVELRPGLLSFDGLPLVTGTTHKLKFKRLSPELALPSQDEAQFANGGLNYKIETVNMASLRIRIKQVEGAAAVRTVQGYRHYTGAGPNNKEIKQVSLIPYELINGQQVADLEILLSNPLDSSMVTDLNWGKILGAETRFATLFIEVTGTPKPGLKENDAQEDPRTKTAQALVQLTDVGLAWKSNRDEVIVFAFSCQTGEPLEGVALECFGEDAAALNKASTGADGTAKILRDVRLRHLRATHGADSFTATFDQELPSVSMWNFPVRPAYENSMEIERKVMLFTDRALYRPGETVRLKGIVRRLRGNELLPADGEAARIRLTDGNGREILSEPVTVSANGSFDQAVALPATNVGNFSFHFEYPGELETVAGEQENWWHRSRVEDNAKFHHSFEVQEFRRNAFEVEQSLAAAPTGAKGTEVSLGARYFQDQPVAGGKVEWQLRVNETGFYPARFRDYLFGDHRVNDSGYWAYYYGDSEMYGSPQRGGHSERGSATLDAEGKVGFSIPIPEGSTPTPRVVRVFSGVTDLNLQTLGTSSAQTLHPADVYAGVSRIDRLVRVGEDLPLKVLALDPDGNLIATAVEMRATWTREINEQTKVRSADGDTAVRNDARTEALTESNITVAPADAPGGGTSLAFRPEHAGRHLLTLEGKDSAGRTFRTVTQYYVYGQDEYPWAWENDMKIKLVPERDHYKPGETARVLVLSPIEGTALITIEREGLLRKTLVNLKADNPVIEVPLTADDAPNVFVSVLIIKGAAENQREHKEPMLRLGFCEINVENQRERLAVEIATAPTVRPGAPLSVKGRVTLADGRPAAGAELTVYAEDEGTLAVMGYDNPDPMKFFYSPRVLAVQSGSSLGKFLAESPDSQSFYNKGFFVGGGDGESQSQQNHARSNFDPCGFWQPAVMTDADGRYEFSVNVPDTLTRYRVVAVAHHGKANFGQAVNSFIVDKPMMLEPKVPRFAQEGDSLSPQVLVRNNSPLAGVWRISLKLGSEAVGANSEPGATLSEEVTLAPGAAAVVSFETRFVATGEAVWKWSAEPVSVVGAEAGSEIFISLRDSVESRFPVEYPMPLLREVKLIRLDPGKEVDLLDGLSKELLEGRGAVTLELSPSLLVEGAGAAEFLLTYPYGCLEQSTSSLMPWLAVSSLRSDVPSLQRYTPEVTQKAIQAGADRIIGMQHNSGGFFYWPGGSEVADWASAYAGLGLLLAREQGANVPDATVAALKGYLSKKLRGLGETPSAEELEEAARSLWVLALAGAPELAYHDLLETRMGSLNYRARAYLTLATMASGVADAQARGLAIMNHRTAFAGKDKSWMPYENDQALELIVWTALGADAARCDVLLDKLVNQRGPGGHWQTTWVNGWSMMAMASYAKSFANADGEIQMTLKNQAGGRQIVLGDKARTTSEEFALHPGMKLALSSDKTVFARMRLAAKPAIAPQRPVATNGMEITRTYERILPDGKTQPLKEPKLGEIVRVSLRITVPKDDTRYLVVDDPLPSIFETVNSDFATQSGDVADQPGNDWSVSHLELRSDRAVFFLDYLPQSGTYTVTYLARCTLPGAAVAPPAKVEAMYDPRKFALSASRNFQAIR
jgi:uncharacterized protein YfaS (alpha-2-macroglobulin family)